MKNENAREYKICKKKKKKKFRLKELWLHMDEVSAQRKRGATIFKIGFVGRGERGQGAGR